MYDWEPKPYELRLAALNAIRQIDQRDRELDEVLVSAFMSAAWPSRRAQNQ